MDELIELSRTWVKEHYSKSAEHLLKAEEWLRRMYPNASPAMLLAALTHDMERAFPMMHGISRLMPNARHASWVIFCGHIRHPRRWLKT